MAHESYWTLYDFNLHGWTPYVMSRLLSKLLNIGIIRIGKETP